jgi:hypothetical protein
VKILFLFLFLFLLRKKNKILIKKRKGNFLILKSKLDIVATFLPWPIITNKILPTHHFHFPLSKVLSLTSIFIILSLSLSLSLKSTEIEKNAGEQNGALQEASKEGKGS